MESKDVKLTFGPEMKGKERNGKPRKEKEEKGTMPWEPGGIKAGVGNLTRRTFQSPHSSIPGKYCLMWVLDHS